MKFRWGFLSPSVAITKMLTPGYGSATANAKVEVLLHLARILEEMAAVEAI
jgi:hypothetical protein